MMPKKTLDKIDNYERVVISEDDIKKYKLPAKALGVWVIIKEDKLSVRLRKVRLDGFLMSDKNNNHQNLPIKIANAIRKIPDTENVFIVPKIGTRKSHWIAEVISMLMENGILPKNISERARENVVGQIWNDTNPEREGGKLYSSVDGALRIWKKRNGEYKNALIEA